jgi:hypothetical protein
VPALASNIVARTFGPAKLRVTTKRAEIRYVSGGVWRTVVATGAINARYPLRGRPQVRFGLRWRAHLHHATCGRYDGPRLAWLVTACKAPDGSYWALQRWPRNLPLFGQRPSRPDRLPDLRLSHWSGPLETFTVKQDWAFRRYDHLYGAVNYRGHAMHGFRTNRVGAPQDRYGILVYVDTFNSSYGRGWRREMGFVTHNPQGIFCYGFYSHLLRGQGRFPPGNGDAYRATVVGPGVLPDLRWQAKARGRYERAADRLANAEQRLRYTDGLCRPN